MTRVQRDLLTNVLIVLVSVYFVFWGIPLYTPPYPGYGASPALVPYVVVGVMCFMAVLAMVRTVLARRGGAELNEAERAYPDDSGKSGFTQVGRLDLVHLAKFMVPAVLLVIGIHTIGYIPSALGFLVLLQYLMGARNLVTIGLLAMVAVALMYAAMRYGFGVPIPGY